MSGLYSKLIKPIHFLGDIIIINACFFLSYYITFYKLDSFAKNNYFFLLLFYNVGWMAVSYLMGVYRLYRVTGFLGIIINLTRALLFYLILIVAFNGVLTVFGYSRYLILISIACIALGILVWRLSLYMLLRLYRRSGYNFSRIIIAGFNDASIDLYDFFRVHPEHGYRFMGFFDDKQNVHPDIKGRIEDIDLFCKNNNIDEIYCLSSELSQNQLSNLIDFADNNFLKIKLLPDLLGLKYKNFKLDLYGDLPIVSVRSIPLDDSMNKIFKRSFDIFFSLLICILILSWLIPLLAIVIKIDSKGPVFFKQKRSGLNNNEFWCYKFRSMTVNQDSHVKQAIKGDSRVTAVGDFLRRTSLDEMPQFFNVLIGNMSVVGPRPHMVKHTEEYSLIIEKYMLRHLIKPGITGLSQVVGYRGETEDSYKMKKRVKMDIYYIENWYFLLDMKIVFSTMWNVFKGDKNAH